MSWPFGDRGLTASQLIGEHVGYRGGKAGMPRVSRDAALRHSAVWACLRLRADLVSTMPVDVYRRVSGVQVAQKKPPIFSKPGGERVLWEEWAYSSQVDLDSCGNDFGVITAVDGFGLPARIELAPANEVTLRKRNGVIKVQIGGDEYDYSEIWHEKQYTVSGLPVGLSPIAYAAMQISSYLSAGKFALDWFSRSAVPAAHLKNTEQVLDGPAAAIVKQRFEQNMRDGDVFVSGNDWEYNMLSAKASESMFLEAMKFSIPDVCRFLGVPGDMIDAESSTGHVTYANVTQRNLQLLIMNIGPSIVRREAAFTAGLVPGQRYVKLNRGALLAMDLKSRYEAHKVGIDGRFLGIDEARELEDLPPLTPEQEAQFARLWPKKATDPTPQGSPAA